ncbi:MAG: hypothetical protein OEW48_05745 [Phycisphaerae bacterium]|nr:hypothetical protein [Phycisphaerae bacterium]
MSNQLKSHIEVIFQIILISSPYLISAHANESGTTFESAFGHARSYPVQFHNPVSVQEGINRYAAVIEKFPSHDRLYEAKLGIFELLKCDGTKESLSQAVDIIEELTDNSNLDTLVGQNISLKFADFHIENARGYAFQDLNKTENIIQRLRTIASADNQSLLRLRVAKRTAKIDILRNRELAALTNSVNILEEAMSWAKSGFWAGLYKNNRPLYKEYVKALGGIASAAGWAMERCDKYQEVSRLLRDKPMLLFQFKILRDAWKKYEIKHILGGPEEFEKLQEEIFQTSLDDILDDSPQTKLPVSDSASEIIIKTSLVSTPNSSPSNKIESENIQKVSSQAPIIFEPEKHSPKSTGLWTLGVSVTVGALIIIGFLWYRKS